jgi:hypothetical protein
LTGVGDATEPAESGESVAIRRKPLLSDLRTTSDQGCAGGTMAACRMSWN